jgi:hypothetical protein
MTTQQQGKVMDLFNQRKLRRMEIAWIEDEPWHPKYEGKEVTYKWSL